jgi:phosphatidylserine decarboxylase
MTIHREGYKLIMVVILVLLLVNIFAFQFFSKSADLRIGIFILSLIVFIIVLQFFRHPMRKIITHPSHVLSPADGKIVTIEEVMEEEFYHEKRIQISIFMSPVNVHLNRFPISGTVDYFKHHHGEYLVAWHPKSSQLNERTTVVIRTHNNISILVRQIAGYVARRIVCYAKEKESFVQGEELGFIKFGSRVDVFVPLNSKITVQLNQKVKGGKTVLSEI